MNRLIPIILTMQVVLIVSIYEFLAQGVSGYEKILAIGKTFITISA